MAERLPRSSDVPSFDTYPASPPVSESETLENRLLAEGRSRLLEEGRQPSSLEQRAADLGAAAGKVVSIVRRARVSVEHLPDHPVFNHLSGLAENARARAEYLGAKAGKRAQRLVQSAREKTSDLGRQARETTADLGRQARFGYYRARLRANQTAREYPVHVVVAAGVVGFLIGVGLRIRRANRAY
jgi:ElaB/YqjD/DUF883 family membrane-anchored ribosome-binding protein